jgi:PII-like signaling protein
VTHGSQLTLYATRQRHHGSHKTVVAWVLDEAGKAGIHGATVTEVREGIDAFGRYHSARFYELADQPVAVTVVACDARIDALLDTLRNGGVKLFFVRCPVEFDMLGAPEGEGSASG